MTDAYKEKKRLEVLETAEKVFIRKGYQHTTMTDIVQASGWSRGAVYTYYPNTETMFQAILAEKDKGFESYMEHMLSTNTSVWQVLTAYIDQSSEQLHTASSSFGTVVYEYLLMHWRDEEKMNFFKDRVLWATAYFKGLIEQGIRKKEFKQDLNSEAIGNIYFLHQDGMYLQAMVGAVPWEKMKEQEELFKEMLSGILLPAVKS
ncbi:TetR/AcrR family transcriptional regulator [Terribacillus saccharophilus]|uniref:TetR/AcrR family transcriptional regulator n=1 Tax=Terribacillus saccharophilus TaxID=361277 RepID=UPI003982B87A